MGVPVKKTGKGKKPSGSKQPPQRTFEDYFEEAELAFMSDDLDTARASYAKAMEMQPDNLELLDAYGSFLAEVGPREEAITVLKHACELEPDTGFEKYMYLGQILDQEDNADEAQASLRKGIHILRGDLANAEEAAKNEPAAKNKKPNNDEDDSENEFAQPEAYKEALSSALCSLAELLMGTANRNPSDEVAAKAMLEESEALLGEAQNLWPESPEPKQALCSLRKNQGKEDEALVLLRESMALWFKPVENDSEDDQDAAAPALVRIPSKLEGDDEDNEDDESEGYEMDLQGMDLPSFEFRFETAKLLLELDETTDAAVQVLEGLIEENDSVPHVWLLLAVAYQAGGHLEESAEAVDEGLQVAQAMGLPTNDELIGALNTVKGQLDELAKAGAGAGAGGDSDD